MTGCEWVIEAHGCDEASLRDLAKAEALFAKLVAGLSLHPVEPAQWHRFPEPGGITGLLLLAESHLACHTFPEYRSMCLNVFCCRTRPEWDFTACLKSVFGAARVDIRRLNRTYGGAVS